MTHDWPLRVLLAAALATGAGSCRSKAPPPPLPASQPPTPPLVSTKDAFEIRVDDAASLFAQACVESGPFRAVFPPGSHEAIERLMGNAPSVYLVDRSELAPTKVPPEAGQPHGQRYVFAYEGSPYLRFSGSSQYTLTAAQIGRDVSFTYELTAPIIEPVHLQTEGPDTQVKEVRVHYTLKFTGDGLMFHGQKSAPGSAFGYGLTRNYRYHPAEPVPNLQVPRTMLESPTSPDVSGRGAQGNSGPR